MAYPALLFTIGAIFAAPGLLYGGWAWLLLWPAFSFWVVVLGGYVLRRPRIIGKRPDGSIVPWARVFFLPFLLFSHAMWWIYRSVSREDACNEIAPGLWLGRWPRAADLPAGVDVMVVDITAELPSHEAVTQGRRYVCLPALDSSVPDEEAFAEMLGRLERESVPLLIHCAFGHGRSAMMVGALLVRRGLARDAAEAETLLKARRPKVSMSARQRDYLKRAVLRATR